jgi:REP element-mobilizing transposase RayT
MGALGVQAMPQSLAQIYVHCIFSTKNREPLLHESIRRELFAYTATVLQGIECWPVEIGGVEDHVHVLCCLGRNLAVKDLISEMKTATSKWLKTKGPQFQGFYWQGGYGAFSVSPSQLDAVTRYIRNQPEHHRTVSFQDEVREFFARYKVTYDERYVWD